MNERFWLHIIFYLNFILCFSFLIKLKYENTMVQSEAGELIWQIFQYKL